MKKIYMLLLIMLFSFFVISCENNNKVENPPAQEIKPEPQGIFKYLGGDGDVHRMNITTDNLAFPENKETYIKGSLNVTEQDTSVIKHPDMTMGIKLRGNSTSIASKKPFKIKFDTKQSLFGLEAAKEWVLLANYYDKTNMRNYLAYTTANKLNLGFQPTSIFIDVYFNDEYIGLYLLTEQMEANKGRVDIEDNYSIDGVSSFLLEADDRAKEEYSGYKGHCYISSGGYDFALKSPDADDYIDALAADDTLVLEQFNKDTAWLQDYMDKVSRAIQTSDYYIYSQYINVESFIDYYLVQEMFKNVDVGSTSQFYIIDQSEKEVKLKMGPVWDFDLAAGVVDKTSKAYEFYASHDLFVRVCDKYYKYLFKDEKFKELVSIRYTEVRDDVFASILDEFKTTKVAINNALNRNIKKWPLSKTRTTWVEINALSDYYYSIAYVKGHYDLLTNTLEERLEILDDNYLIK